MTANQAYQILNVNPGASLPEIEQAYRAALRALLLQLVPGQPVAVRQRAQDQITQLKTAFEFLKNMAASHVPPARSAGYARPQGQPTPAPQGQPVGGRSRRPARSMPYATSSTLPPVSNRVLMASFAMAAAVMLIIVLFCTGLTIPHHQNKTARLRVLSVPWSYVKVDGESLGPGGQIDAFALKPGDHKVVLRQGDRVLWQTVHLPENSETVIKAQLEKGRIDVADKRI